ncbi:YaaR family protein [Geomonas sp. Red32]|uniref:YaaR family protein n=1 Tax=Geomonas sp. Red32 TaxID=2912856 RepID=UPI00202CE182|nr:YaaR family protein [Geomonas sp. Red32]MCM0080082.1 YaaR family protein [Geomonas sp. Red32]
MRIDEKAKSRAVAKRGKGTPAKSVTGVNAPLFANRLTAIARSNSDYAGELQQLKELIDKAGDVLEQEPTISNFKAFRELIATMARKVTSEAYRVEMLSGGLSGRTHEIIAVIDKEADLLYHLVMREQKDHIRITGQIIKIKGLVVDFIL